MNIAEQLENLERLRASGSLSEEEFRIAKDRVLSGQTQPPLKQHSSGTIHGLSENTFCTLMHVSQLLNYSIVGVVVPVMMWIIGKDQSEMVRRQGTRMINWMISSLIYAVIAGILWLVLIGIPMLFAVAIMGFVFPIMAAIKANEGVVWSYPLTIRFLPED